MQISKEEKVIAIQLFRWINPSIKYDPERWFKGHPINLNVIYEYRDGNGRPIAIWTDFMGLNDVKISRILKKIETVPHVFFMEHFNGRIRVGWKVKRELRLDDTLNRISPEK